MKEEAQAPVRAKLTWGDVAFGLEIARWRTRRLLNTGEMLRRICGVRRLPAPIATPGLLLVEIIGLGHGSFQTALKSGTVPFFESLIAREQYQLVPLRGEGSLAQLLANANTALQSHHAPLPHVVQGPRRFHPAAKRWTGVELAAGQPLVHSRLPAGGDGSIKVDPGELRQIDGAVRALYRQALLSATADYEVWIVAEGPDGFALLPGNVISMHLQEGDVGLPTLQAAMLRALGLGGAAPVLNRARGRSENVLRVMTYNIHSCVGLDGKLAPSRIARIIRAFDPDIVALQEVDLKRARSKGEDQAACLARELGMRVSFCCTADRAWERYGHALLTHEPATVISSGLFAGEDQSAEQRGALLVKIEIAGRSTYIANTHFGLTGRDRLRQAKAFLGPEWLGQVPSDAPLIVCGDFNMSPASRPYSLLSERLKDAHTVAKANRRAGTFPAPMPLATLDFVFVSQHFAVKHLESPRNCQTSVASDHLPVIADLTF